MGPSYGALPDSDRVCSRGPTLYIYTYILLHIIYLFICLFIISFMWYRTGL